jgi:hypothetical protein
MTASTRAPAATYTPHPSPAVPRRLLALCLLLSTWACGGPGNGELETQIEQALPRRMESFLRNLSFFDDYGLTISGRDARILGKEVEGDTSWVRVSVELKMAATQNLEEWRELTQGMRMFSGVVFNWGELLLSGDGGFKDADNFKDFLWGKWATFQGEFVFNRQVDTWVLEGE